MKKRSNTCLSQPWPSRRVVASHENVPPRPTTRVTAGQCSSSVAATSMAGMTATESAHMHDASNELLPSASHAMCQVWPPLHRARILSLANEARLHAACFSAGAQRTSMQGYWHRACDSGVACGRVCFLATSMAHHSTTSRMHPLQVEAHSLTKKSKKKKHVNHPIRMFWTPEGSMGRSREGTQSHQKTISLKNCQKTMKCTFVFSGSCNSSRVSALNVRT